MSQHFALGFCLSLLLAGSAVGATQNNHSAPTLVQPADGAVVEHQVLVRIGYTGKAPQGPSEGTGIVMDNGSAQPGWSNDERNPESASAGPADGTGLIQTADHHPRGPHFAVLIDAAAPQPGDLFHADAKHVPFPPGNPQMTLTLSPGPHQLALVRLNDEGQVSRRYREQASTCIIVR